MFNISVPNNIYISFTKRTINRKVNWFHKHLKQFIKTFYALKVKIKMYKFDDYWMKYFF